MSRYEESEFKEENNKDIKVWMKIMTFDQKENMLIRL